MNELFSIIKPIINGCGLDNILFDFIYHLPPNGLNPLLKINN